MDPRDFDATRAPAGRGPVPQGLADPAPQPSRCPSEFTHGLGRVSGRTPPGIRKALHPRGLAAALVAMLPALVSACDIQEITVAPSEDVVVAEIYLASDVGGISGTAWLHRTLGNAGVTDELSRADVFLRTESRAQTVRLRPAEASVCAGDELPNDFLGWCYSAGPLDPRHFGPGATVEAIVRLPDGGRITGRTRVPANYDLLSPRIHRRRMCSLKPAERLTVEWTRAEGAWAYISETQIINLTAALEDSDVEVEQDPLLLVGLSVSEADTTIVFPSEFGLFERVGLGRDLALVLQEGLPFGTQAEVVIGAADRNYVNWVRRGVFNPSGIVRTPSLQGDGTGVFGSVVRTRFTVDAGLEVPTPGSCKPGDP